MEEICKKLSKEPVEKLRTITNSRLNERTVCKISQHFLKYEGGVCNVETFREYLKTVDKEELCRSLARYYLASKCRKESRLPVEVLTRVMDNLTLKELKDTGLANEKYWQKRCKDMFGVVKKSDIRHGKLQL